MSRHSEQGNVRDRSLQDLEGLDWGEGNLDSHLVKEVHRLRRLPLKRYRIEDLRLMIGQGRGLPWLVPVALDHLIDHPLAQGDFYRGDLLRAVASVRDEYWQSRPEQRLRLVAALQLALTKIGKVRVPNDLPPFLQSALTRHKS